jgi:predicted ATPase
MFGGFVGRPAELDQLQKCAARAKSGDPQLVFVEGVPGIGKSSLLAQFTATLSGWRNIVVTAYEDEKRLPFGVLTRLLSAGRIPGSAGDSPTAAITDPIALGAELLQLLGDLEQSAPVAVVIDDAPWTDPQSMRALTFALRRLQGERVLVVLTMRSQDV